MTLTERVALTLLRRMDPERAHGLSIRALALGLAPTPGPVTSARLRTEVAGLVLPNPVGLAAGYDKNAEAVSPLSRSGFGFIEVGAATPRPQPGNPRPRLFRLPEDRGVINRFGFNNEGAEVIAARLARAERAVPVGLNLGANKDSADRAADFATVLGIDGIIATNTTLGRDMLRSPLAREAGGLSGAPLFTLSTKVLARLSMLTEGKLPLIGVGGISSAEHAYAKIKAGASAVQLYSALVWGGLSLAGDIARGLDALLERDGFSNVAEAVGVGREDWL